MLSDPWISKLSKKSQAMLGDQLDTSGDLPRRVALTLTT